MASFNVLTSTKYLIFLICKCRNTISSMYPKLLFAKDGLEYGVKWWCVCVCKGFFPRVVVVLCYTSYEKGRWKILAKFQIFLKSIKTDPWAPLDFLLSYFLFFVAVFLLLGSGGTWLDSNVVTCGFAAVCELSNKDVCLCVNWTFWQIKKNINIV